MANVPNPIEFSKWLEDAKSQLEPPVCNKLIYKDQLKVMVVGGPNQRQDYHIEEGEELFFQLKGNMHLPIVEKGQHRDILIPEGEMFLLPPRIPHSPQREANSLGLVIERDRKETEIDGLRWYMYDDNKAPTQKVAYEEFFHCTDLGVQLKPVIERYRSSEAFKTGKPQQEGVGVPKSDDIPIQIDTETSVPSVIHFKNWIQQNWHSSAFPGEKTIFNGKDFEIIALAGNVTSSEKSCTREAWLYQIKGNSSVVIITHDHQKSNNDELELKENNMVLIPPGSKHQIKQIGTDSLCLKLLWEGKK